MSQVAFRSTLQPPLEPHSGSALRMLCVARKSKEEQTSLADQQALYKRWLETNYDGPLTVKVISTTGGGERLDRRELKRMRFLIKNRRVDAVLTEDLGRIVRRIHAVTFCELCEDHGVRLIAINDHVDTFREDWRDQSFFAAYRHERHNTDLRKRITRSLHHRFLNGGAVRPPIFGYGLRESTIIDAKGRKIHTDEMLYKHEWAEPVYAEWFDQLESGASYSEVADWCNENQVPLPPHAIEKGAKRWTGPLVRRTVHNPMLKGVRERNNKKSRRINKTGRHVSEKAPVDERLRRSCPHLAFIEPARWDRLISMLTKRNSKYTVPTNSDARLGRPKKRSTWPGQQIYCGVCGRMYVYGGHGQATHLMCNGAKAHLCWNGASVDGPLAARKLSAAIWQEVAALPDIEEVTRSLLEHELEQADSANSEGKRELRRAQAENDRRMQNLMRAIGDVSWSDSLKDELQRLEVERLQLADRQSELDELTGRRVVVPTADVIRQMFADTFQGLAVESWKFARLMRKLIPKIIVFPHQSCDGGKVVLRARFRLDLGGLDRSLKAANCLRPALERTLCVDLFDPPQRVLLHEEAARMVAGGTTQRDVGKARGVSQPIIQHALALHRLIEERGLPDAYLQIREPNMDGSKFRRHLHRRYRFDPLADAGQF